MGSCRDCGRKWPDLLEARGGGPGTVCGLGPAGADPFGCTCCHRVREGGAGAVSGRRVLEKQDGPRASGLWRSRGLGGAGAQLWSARTPHGTACQFLAISRQKRLCRRLPRPARAPSPLFYNLYQEESHADCPPPRTNLPPVFRAEPGGGRRRPLPRQAPGEAALPLVCGGHKLFSGRI